MKSKSLFIGALLMVSVALAAFGKEEPTKVGLAVVPVKGTEVFKVIYKGEVSGRVKLNVYNKNGQIVFMETIKSEGFVLPLNFYGLEFGEYTFEIVDGTSKKIEKVNYQPKTSSVKSVRVSKVANEERKFVLAVANEGAKVINIKIFDSANTLIYNEGVSIDGNFSQIYSIREAGSYTFEIADEAGNVKVAQY